MDVLIRNGDVAITPWGEYRMAEGLNEAVQKAMLSAQIKKGSFVYNKSLGTELCSVSPEEPLSLKTAELLLNEALIGSGCEVKVNSLFKASEDKYKVVIRISNGNESTVAEVSYYANL